MFCESHIDADDGRTIETLTFGPISIAPEFKRQGYGKCGFAYASQFGIRYHGMPEGEDAPFFLCLELMKGYLEGITAEYADPEGYGVDDADEEVFDKNFPYKEKLVLPGQIF